MRFVRAALALSIAAAAAHCAGRARDTKPLRRSAQRVFVIGFDGMDPTLARKWMDEGKLPNLKRLAEEGTFKTLGYDAAVGVADGLGVSFATGVNPGKHNIYDFLIRDLQTYLPDLGMVRKRAAAFLWGLHSDQAAESGVHARRHVVLGHRGARPACDRSVLTVPVTFPPEEMPHGEMLVRPAAARHPRHDGHVLLLRAPT